MLSLMFRMGQSSLTCSGSSHSASTPLSWFAPTRRMLSRTSPRVWARFMTPRWLNRKSYSSSSGQDLPQLQRVLVDGRALVPEVVGADDGGVAGHVAAGQPALFQDGDVGHAVVLGQEVGGGQAVPAAADDHGVVGGLGLRVAPEEVRVLRELLRAHWAAPIMSASRRRSSVRRRDGGKGGTARRGR